MIPRTVFRKASLFCVLISLLLLAGCGGGAGNQSNSGSSSITPTVPAATATVQALMQKITLVGQPTAKMLDGTTFEVSGQLKNGDAYQHDITIQGALLDGAGKVIVTGTKFLDNVKAGQTVNFTIQGTTPQATWNSVQVTVVKISENIGGTGGD